MLFQFPKRRKRNKLQKRALRRQAIVVCIFVVVCVVGILGFHYVNVYAGKIKEPIAIKVDPNLGVELFVKDFLADNSALDLLPILECESEFKHFEDDGTVLKNKEGSSAIGVAQIMSSKHPDPRILRRYNRDHDTALTIEDFDLTSLIGNLGYALILFEVRGTRDWECAKLL